MKIPLVDLKAQYETVGADIEAAVRDVLHSSRFLGGPVVEGFEADFAAFCGADHAIAVSNGTSALYLALAAAGVGPGDEVITSPMTFIATVESIRLTGADVVFADCRADDLLLDPDAAAAAVTDRTAAIVPVHLYGQPCDMAAFDALAERHGLAVVEDAAQAHGATIADRAGCAGAWGRAGAFSFYPGKNLGAIGDGGAVTTSDAALAEKARMLRDHGRRPTEKYRHDLEGFNFRLSAVQAAALAVKLPHLAEWTRLRAAAAAAYDERLAALPVERVLQQEGRASAHHLYVVRAGERDRVLAGLKEAGIGAGIHYPIPLHLQPAFAAFGHGPGAFPAAEAAADTILSLPLFPELDSAQLDWVAEKLGHLVGAGS